MLVRLLILRDCYCYVLDTSESAWKAYFGNSWAIIRGKKLEDWKALTGARRLTKTMMNHSAKLFWFTILNKNTGCPPTMVKTVNATLYHVASTDQKPDHNFWSEGPNSWCSYQRDQENYRHSHKITGTKTYKHRLPRTISTCEPISGWRKKWPLLEKIQSKTRWSNAKKAAEEGEMKRVVWLKWEWLYERGGFWTVNNFCHWKITFKTWKSRFAEVKFLIILFASDFSVGIVQIWMKFRLIIVLI